MDASAYMDAPSWQALLDENGWNQVHLRDGRYDCVIHLQTAADGAEHFYNSKTNATRLETPEQARFLDRRCKEVWVGHPYLCTLAFPSLDFVDFYILANMMFNVILRHFLHECTDMVDNSTDFYTKVGRVVEAVSKFIGAYEPGITKRKFLVRSVASARAAAAAQTDVAAFPVQHHDSIVMHDFINTTDGSQARLRARGQGGQFAYTLTFRVKVRRR